jgi:hypothetical protein
MENRNITWGLVRAIPDNVEESRTIPFVISDESRDRYGTVFSADGWELDSYQRNNIVGYQHMDNGMFGNPDPNMVIGMGKVMKDKRQLIGETTFEPKDINPLAETVFRKVIFGSLKSASVRFNPLEQGYWGVGDQARGAKDETYFIGKRELLEYSIVNIPGNRNAQRRSMRDEKYGAFAYAYSELGSRFTKSQIENLRVCDVLDLLDGKDIEIRSADPDEVRRLLAENEAQKAQIQRLNEQIGRYKRILK